MSNEPVIDKEFLYKEWNKHSRWKDDLHRQLAHKALDIPEDEMISANRTNVYNGLGWREMLILGLTATTIGCAWYLFNQEPPKEIPSPPPATDTDTKVGFEISGDPKLNPS